MGARRHSMRLCYRDLKPENTMVMKDGFIVLVDMGSAKVLHDHPRTYTASPSAQKASQN